MFLTSPGEGRCPGNLRTMIRTATRACIGVHRLCFPAEKHFTAGIASNVCKYCDKTTEWERNVIRISILSKNQPRYRRKWMTIACAAAGLDELDAAILRYLVRHGRATNYEVGEAVGLSASAASRRILALEASGAIRGYRALIDDRSARQAHDGLSSASRWSASPPRCWPPLRPPCATATTS